MAQGVAVGVHYRTGSVSQCTASPMGNDIPLSGRTGGGSFSLFGYSATGPLVLEELLLIYAPGNKGEIVVVVGWVALLWWVAEVDLDQE